MSSPKIFAKFRKGNSKYKGGESPPKCLIDELDGPAPHAGSMNSSQSSTINSVGGLSSTPPNYYHDESSSPLSVSPGTPRKDWEVNYKSYLSNASDDKGGLDSSDASETSCGMGMVGLNIVGNGKQPELLFLPQSRSLPQNHFANNISGGQHMALHRRHSPPTHTAEEVKATKLDSSVHGGSMFKSMFKGGRHKKEDKVQAQDSQSRNDNLLDLDKKMHKKNQSCGTLDVPIHRGAQATVGKGIRPARTKSDDDSRGRIHSSDFQPPMGGAAPKAVRSGIFGPKGLIIGPRRSSKEPKVSRRNKRRQQKVAFTEIHNDSKDSAAAYLGEEKSICRGRNFEALKKPAEYTSELTAVSEEKKSSLASLTLIEGHERLSENGRFLMAPAIMAMSPDNVFSLMGGEDTRHPLAPDNLTFGKINLGEATVAHIVSKGLVEEEYAWSEGTFVLRQNYLLEYKSGDDVKSRPLCFAFLQNASVRRHEAFDNALRLDYYQNYSSSVPRKSVLIRLKSQEQRERWLNCLITATRLKLEDLYEYNRSSRPLGKGRFATVYAGRRRRGEGHSTNQNEIHTKAPGGNGILKKKPSFTSLLSHDKPLAREQCDCAIKIIDKDKFWERVRKGKERADSIVRETAVQAALLADMDIYPGFLRVRSFFETLDKVVLELELLQGMDLFRYVSSRDEIGEVESANIMYDILRSVDAMKKLGIAHRDIKPANILMESEGENGVKVKLGDFGMGTFVGEDNLVRGRCGTPGYVAPEIMSAAINGGYANDVDMFSAGVIMYILLCGYEPFYGESEEELINENKRGKVEYPEDDWRDISVEGRDLLEKMLEKDPSKRVQADKALQHPWIKRRVEVEKKQMLKQAPSHSEPAFDFACVIS